MMEFDIRLNALSWDMDFALEQVGGDRGFLLEALGYFLQAAREDLKGIGHAIEKSEPQRIRQRAHSLKGASLNIGMKGIYEVSRKLEKYADTFGSYELRALYQELEGLLNQVQALYEAGPRLFEGGG